MVGCVENEEAARAHREWLASLSEEQKEYEAHKLMTQLDKLMNTGVVKPATIGEDGRPHPVEHVLQLADEYGKDAKKQTNGNAAAKKQAKKR